ncbi:ComEC/Rec2 family competence protein [Ruegeria aquimaris]|uniref:ComEC family competence protein n=1 Tax=Ruegeria aquimaris TaxID=2984333 RepID=A0ABT3AMJ9_9RHOB|nr:ComEC/Rec2 family competence protein [Ruegeria sp. XHP0148]MCV2889908.1 ComEC family competence protein [Ruegeria sp. XHP0148]
MRVLAKIERGLLEQRGHLFPWVPVFLGIGIGLYFLPSQEPGLAALGAIGFGTLFLSVLTKRFSGAWSPLLWALVLSGSGFLLAAARAHYVAAPVLDWRYYGPVEGRVIALDRSASDRLRVTLDQVRMDRIAGDQIPAQVRISLSDDSVKMPPGGRVMAMAHLAPPQGPVEPGGFDFRRHAWFQTLGAIGYTRTPVLVSAAADTGAFRLRLLAVRMAASDRIRDHLPGDVGGFAAAVTTGDRSGVSQSALVALRASNLAHLLAISGLHMGLLAGFVFSALRVCLSLVPSLALRLPVRKFAAVGALLVAAGYLALSGGNVATQRAFVMVAVMLGAILLDRRALSLRAVAAAAVCVLLLRPEALLGPGFQMSFAATVALVAVFGWIRDAEISPGPRWAQPLIGLVVSSAVAGFATAPVAAAHFNTIAHFGLLANLLSVPLMGLLIIPAAVLALVLFPLSLDWIGLELMGLGLSWILGVAHWVAALDDALGFVARPEAEVLPLLALGGLWIVLWRGWLRLAGVPVVALSLVLWSLVERPEILVADTGGLVGIMTPEGRALSKPRGSGFIAGVWLENDGDGADQPSAAARWPGEGNVKRLRSGAVEIVHVTGKRGAQHLTGCTKTEIVISSVPLNLKGPCTVFDPVSLSRTGAVSLGADGKIIAVAGQNRRLWSPALQRDQ